MDIRPLSEVEDRHVRRFSTTEPALDNQFSGGLVVGSLSLWSGAAGVGKSRLMAKITRDMNESGKRVLYITGEMPAPDFKSNYLKGYDSNNYFVARIFSINEIVKAIRQVNPDIVVVDSVTAVNEFMRGRGAKDMIEGKDGRDGLRAIAEETDCHIILLNQQNADGSSKGGTSLVHWVDTEVFLNRDIEEKDTSVFKVRVEKNRYGSSGVETFWRHTGTGVEHRAGENFTSNLDGLTTNIDPDMDLILDAVTVEEFNEKIQEFEEDKYRGSLLDRANEWFVRETRLGRDIDKWFWGRRGYRGDKDYK